MTITRNTKKPYLLVYCFIITLTSCLLAEVSAYNDLLTGLESNYSDLWHKIAGRRLDHQPQVTIVAIDEETLSHYKDDPLVFWGPYLARAIKILRENNATIIGVDLIFSINSESWLQKLELPESEVSRTFEIPMREQLNSGDVILVAQAVNDKDDQSEIILPVVDYLYSLPDNLKSVGFANLYTDDDGVVRHYVQKLFDDDREPSLTFATLLAKRAGAFDKKSEQGKNLLISAPQTIRYAGPPGTIPRISFHELLNGENLTDNRIAELITNKIIILSVERSGFIDVHLTPFSQGWLMNDNSGMMTGAEIHANIIETIINGGPRPLPNLTRIAILGTTVFLGTFLFLHLTPGIGFGCLMVIGLFSCILSYLFFTEEVIILLANTHVSLGLSYLTSLGKRLTREERQRQIIQQIFRRYVSPEVMEEVLSKNTLPALGGETMAITVLFSDIRNFTSISEKLSPDEVVTMLNTYYSRICERITENGGIVDKFIGDAVMAIFGAPVNHQDQALRSLIAAKSIAMEAEKFQDWLQINHPDKRLPEFKIGIGVHHGLAVVGNIGSVKRMEYTAIGDTINIASRLESLSKKMRWTIVASQAAIESAGDKVVVGENQLVRPSGREGEIRVYEILGVNDLA